MKEISLKNGMIATVDDADYLFIAQWQWYPLKGKHTFYAVRRIIEGQKKKHIFMHRLILGVTDQKVLVDHVDHNGLNNTRGNLRPCNNSQNMCNVAVNRKKKKTSQYKGVSWSSKSKKWKAQIKKDNKLLYLGLFESEIDAAASYNTAAIVYHGAFAYLNAI